MMKKIAWAGVAAILATSFVSPALAQSYAFSGKESAALSAYYNGQPAVWDYAPAFNGGHSAVRGEGRKLYDEAAPNVQPQTYWPSAAAMGSSR
jgi:hypothetical protein